MCIAAHKLRSRNGFTLVELLMTLIMSAMAGAVVVAGLEFAVRSYSARTGDIEAQLLCETVSMLVQDELTNKTDTFYAPDYNNQEIDGKTFNPSIDGVTLSEAAFGYGARKIRISVTSGDSLYHVTVSVPNRTVKDAENHDVPIVSNEFTVRPLG